MIMRRFILSLVAALAFATPAFPQGTTTINNLPAANAPLYCTEVVAAWQIYQTVKIPVALAGAVCQSATAPLSPFAGQQWWDTSAGADVWSLRAYDGASWLPIGRLDTTAHVWTPATNKPVQTVTGTSKTFAATDFQYETRRSNSTSAMTDTFPAAAAGVNGALITVTNVGASASDTITAGSGTTICGANSCGASTVVPAGRSLAFVFDSANTAWRPTANTASAVIGPTSVASGNLAKFADSTGKTIVDSGFSVANLAPVAPVSLVYVVANSGGDFTSVQAAIDSLNSSLIPVNATINIQVADGTFAQAAPILIQSAFGRNFVISGQHAYSTTLTSVQSSSGATGAWSIVLNVGSVTNLAVNDYIAIANAAAGTNPTYLDGAFKVTNVDAVNTRITVSSTHHAAAAPSGAVTGTITILKSVLTFAGMDGIDIYNGGVGINLGNIALVGDGTGSYAGISDQDGDRVLVTSPVAVVGFGGTGALVNYNSEINGAYPILTAGNGVGFRTLSGGAIVLVNPIANGNVGDGVANVGGYFEASGGGVFTGNGSHGTQASAGGQNYVASTTSTGNSGWGYLNDSHGYTLASGATVANNASGDYSLGFVGASVNLTGTVTKNNPATAGFGYTQSGSTFTDTGTTGTTSALYGNVFGGNTISATNTKTYTNEYANYFKVDTAGSGATLSAKWALGADSGIIGNWQFAASGAVTGAGSINIPGSNIFLWSGGTVISQNNTNGVFWVANNAQTGIGQVTFGARDATTAGYGFKLVSGNLNFTTGDGTAGIPVTASNSTLTAAAPTVAASQIGFGGTTAAAANCNVASPAPTACLVINVAGTTRYVPYY